MKKVILSVLLFSSQFLSAEDSLSNPPERGFLHTFMMLGLAGVLFYFIMFRPEQKRRKALETQRSILKKGDRVTAVGIIGTIAKVQDKTVIVRMYDGTKLEFIKEAISEVISSEEEENEPEIKELN